LIFRLEGAVVDTTHSVDAAVRRTVQNYFSHFLDIHGSGHLVSEQDVQAFRMAGGLDNPWDLSAALIRYLVSLIQEPLRRGADIPENPGQALSFLKARSQPVRHLSLDYFQERANFQEAAARIREAGGGIRGVARMVQGGWRHPLLMADGAVGEGNLVAQLYQEIFLGRDYFVRLEGGRARFYRGPGMIEHETLLLQRAMIESLRSSYRGRLGLVTDRSRVAAELTLRRLDVEKLFDVLITREDITGEEARQQRLGDQVRLSSPHPYSIIEAANFLDPGGASVAAHVSSSGDDLRAARSAAVENARYWFAYAVVPPGPAGVRDGWVEHLHQSGAHEVWETPADMVAYLRNQ
jgi:phosphoglycolate phosphatase-like HAD superfamily hydrolase